VNDCCKFIDCVVPEDGVVWVQKVNDIKGDDFGSHSGILPEGHIHIDFAKCLSSLVAEAV
jgi:hypothetical protein